MAVTERMAHKAENIHSLALYRKESLETLALDDDVLATFPRENTESSINQNTQSSGDRGWRVIHTLWVIFICPSSDG